MIEFEKYLIEKGYTVSHRIFPHKYDGYHTPSTMTNITNDYEKDGALIRVGLGEAGYSPYVVYPELYEVVEGWDTELGSKYTKTKLKGAVEMKRLQSELTNEELEKTISIK